MTSNRTRGIAALFVVCLCLLAAPAGSDQLPQAPCPSPSPRAFDPGEVVEIPDTEAPCRLEVRETGVQLLSVEDGSRPDPGIQVRRDGRGRFYSAGAFGFGITITLWDHQGRFLKAFGRAGEGPGELSDRGMISIFVDREDRLHVRDGGFRWSLHLDDSGLLYVYGLGPTRHWRSPGSLGRAPTAEEMDRMAQSYVEVIDTKSGRLLASERNLTRTQFLARFPHGFFRGSKEGSRYKQGDTYGFSWSPRDTEEEDDPKDLLPSVEIVSVELAAK